MKITKLTPKDGANLNKLVKSHYKIMSSNKKMIVLYLSYLPNLTKSFGN